MPRRPLLLAVLLLVALPSRALANPSISVSASAAGPLGLGSTVAHRLALTAGATAETVTVSDLGLTTRVSGDAQTPGPSAVGPAVAVCGTRWDHQHDAYGGGGRSSFAVTLTIPPFGTAFVDTTTAFRRAPWVSDSLDVTWHLKPAQGAQFDVTSAAPDFAGPMGVQLGFHLTRVARRLYAAVGTAASGVDSGRVQLWGYAPGRKHAARLASARVRGGAWAVPRLRLPRNGRWEFYARYRAASKAFANDVSECGQPVSIH
jgi:hypothetical protein